MRREDDHYRVLGVARDAGTPEIRRAYRRLARQHHPDHDPRPESHERFRALADAYAALNDPVRRARYDRAIRSARPCTPHERTAGSTLRGVLDLSAREAQLVAVAPLTLTTTDGALIVLPAGLRDGDEVTLRAGADTIRLAVRVDPAGKS